MKYNKINENDRKRVFEAYENGEDWKSMARTLGINHKTAYKWLYNNHKYAKKKGGGKSKKTEQIVETLSAAIENNASITLLELKQMVRLRFQLDVAINTLKNWLDRELFTVKNVRSQINNMNKEENKEKRAAYMEQFFNARSEGRTPIWVDETNFNLYCKRKEGRSRIGTRASVILPASKGANLHCIGAMSSSQLVLFTTKRGAFKAADCVQWFRDLAETCAQQGIAEPTFIIDNAPVHCRI